MSDMLSSLWADRMAAQKAYDDFVTPLIAEKRALTAEEQEQRSTLRTVVENYDERIKEVEKEEKRSAKYAEMRGRTTAPVADATTSASVTKEADIYGPETDNSYFADMVRSSSRAWPGHGAACQRLDEYGYRVAVEMARGTTEGQRAERSLREYMRTDNSIETRKFIQNMKEYGNAGAATGVEYRLAGGVDSTAASGGSFVTPQYFVSKYAPYRQAGRPFIDQTTKLPLPDYGMTCYLPAVTGPANVDDQGGDLGAVPELDPSATYLSAALTTEAGQVVVSQQLLDRAGPNFAFDQMIFDQLNRAYAPRVDALILNIALATAGTVTYTDGAGFKLTVTSGTGGFYSKVSGAKAAIRHTAGTIMNPTHLWVYPDRWEYMAGWADAQGRPIIVPDYAGPFNAAAAGNSNGDVGIEGATGYRFAGLPAFTDLSLPNDIGGRDQAIVANMAEIYVWEGQLTPAVIPQTYANQLAVLLRLYAYVTGLVRYPSAVQKIAGTGMSTISF